MTDAIDVENLTVELGDAQDALAKVREELEEERDRTRELRDEVKSIQSAYEETAAEVDDLAEELEKRGDSVEEVMGLAARLHDELHRRHAGVDFRFCTDRTCTAWNDLARDRGWRT